MRTDVVHDGTTHSCKVSWWNGWARSLCGETFPPGKFREKLFRGDVTCPDCKDVEKAGKKL